MSVLVTKKHILQKNDFKEVFGRWIRFTPTSVTIITKKELSKMTTDQLRQKIKEI